MKLKKPVTGVMPLWDDEKDSIWMLPGYMDGINQAGAIPFIFPFSMLIQFLQNIAFVVLQEIIIHVLHFGNIDCLGFLRFF